MKNKLVVRYSICLLITALGLMISIETKSQTIEPGAMQTSNYIPYLKSKKIGVVVNKASMLGNLHLVDSLLNYGIAVVKIFSPEHGFNGAADAGAAVSDNSYGKNPIPVISLYGKKKQPSVEDMKGIDLMVFDLQDVGVRFYTYQATLHYVMAACVKSNISLLLLDRPNPNGFYVDGPVLDPKKASFVGMHPVPVVYGLTIGEYAQMINGEGWLPNGAKCKLTVVGCKNYTHSSYYSLPVAPSPNLQSMQSIYLYPSLCFFEGTTVSVGRGTNFPFEVYGHPNYPNQSFSFKPESKPGASTSPPWQDTVCYGIDLRNLSVDSLKGSKNLRLEYLLEMYTMLGKERKFFNEYFNVLAGSTMLKLQITEGKSEAQIRASWQVGLEKYKKIRVKYLLYPDFE